MQNLIKFHSFIHNILSGNEMLTIGAIGLRRPVARQDSSPDIAHFVSGNF